MINRIKEKKSVILLLLAIVIIGSICGIVSILSASDKSASAYDIDSEESEEIPLNIEKLPQPTLGFFYYSDFKNYHLSVDVDSKGTGIGFKLEKPNQSIVSVDKLIYQYIFSNDDALLDIPGEYKFYAKVYGDGITSLDSDYVLLRSFTILEAPEFKITETGISFEGLSIEASYELRNFDFDGGELFTTKTFLTFNEVKSFFTGWRAKEDCTFYFRVNTDNFPAGYYLMTNGLDYSFDVKQLEVPVLSFNDGFFTWTEVEGASGYIFIKGYYGPREYTSVMTVDAVSDYSLSGESTYTVRAIGDDFFNLSSDFCEEYVLSYKSFEVGADVTITGNIMSWSAVPKARTYKILNFGAELYETSETSVNLKDFTIPVGNANLQVCVSGYYSDEENLVYINSYVPPIYLMIEKINAPNIWVPPGQTEHYVILIDDPIPPHATGYELYNGNEKIGEYNGMSIDLTTLDYKFSEGIYNLTAKAVSDTFLYQDSDYSNSIQITITKLNAPVIELNDNTISWQSIANSGKYGIYINETKLGETSGTSIDMRSLIQESGDYKIQIKAITSNILYIDSNYSNQVEISFSKLNTPIMQLSDSVLSWQSIENAIKYEIYNGTDKIAQITQSTIDLKTLYLTEGAYEFKVLALGEGLTLNSELSAVCYISVTKLATPVPVIVGTNLIWEAITGAESYKINVKTADGELVDSIYTSLTSCEIAQFGLNLGEYRFTVQALVDGAVMPYSSEKMTFILRQAFDVPLTVSFEGVELESITVEKGMAVIKPENPEKDGYTFIGWFVGDKEYIFGSAVTEDITIEARFEKNEKIRFFSNTRNIVAVSASVGIMLVLGVGIFFVISKIKGNRSKKHRRQI